MDNERAFRTAALVVLIVSAVLVLTAYGWYAAFNALIPLVMAFIWLIVLVLACWGAGDLVYRRLFGPQELRMEHVFMQCLVGTALLAVAAGVVGLVHLLRPATLLLVLGAFSCHGALRVCRRIPGLRVRMSDVPHWSWLIVGLAGGSSLAAATTFAPFYDQWHYHLAFPYQWLRVGAIVTFPYQAYSFFPSNMGLLYLFGLAGPGAWAAQVIHWWMGVLVAIGAAVVARRIGAPSGGQVLAAAVFAATPSVVQVGALAAADLGVAAFAVGSVVALLELRNDRERAAHWSAVSGAFAGLAVGTKYLALASVAVPVGLAAACLAVGRTPDGTPKLRHLLRVLVPFAVAMTLASSPWFARNAIQTGNPVYPYFATFFGQSQDHQAQSDDRVTSGIGSFALEGEAIPNALALGTFKRRGHAGDIGPVHLWLMSLVLVWLWRHRGNGNALLVFGVFILGLGVWAIGPPLGRYLLPSLALTSALAATSWTEIVDRAARPVRWALGFLLFVLLAANCNPLRGEYMGSQLACFLGFQTEEQYLRDNCTQLDAFRAANTDLPGNARILLVGEPRVYGLDRDPVVEDQFRTPLLVELAESTTSSAEIGRRLRERGITHILWNAAEADRIAAADGRSDFFA
ncbi:MAG: hypothetical protein PVG92_08870, partial [Holophagae bacterium]